MCFVIAMVSLALAYQFFQHGNSFLAGAAVLTAVFFMFLMVRNILHVKKLREKKDDS